ncbi:MAG: hypothetical protein H7Z13_20480 [Ferruginibacter sp.]|nr:hypothetical protein [Ferruginibacter sp.]
MKKQSTGIFTQMSKAQVENLTSVINESLATPFYHPNSKIFTTADLWNVQRQGKGRIKRGLFA